MPTAESHANMAPPERWSSIVASEKPTPVRHIYIQQVSQSVKGSFAISPHADDVYPPVYDKPKDEAVANNRSSAIFETKNSAVGVTVWIMGSDETSHHREKQHRDQPAGKPISIEAKTYMGAIKVLVPQYTCKHPLHIRAKSHNGSVHVHIPPTFSGLLRWTCASGQFKPSKAIASRYVPVGEQHKHRGVGRIKPANWIHDQVERGDSAELITTNGSIMLHDAAEYNDGTSCIIA